MSHNVYTEDNENLLRKLPNYLIKIDKHSNTLGGVTEEIIPCDNLTTAIRIAREEKLICTLYETITSKGRSAEYMIDLSYGVC